MPRYCKDNPSDPGVCLTPSNAGTAGTLSPVTFSAGGATREVTALFYSEDDATIPDTGMYLAIDPALPSGTAARMTLSIGGETWSLASATRLTRPGSALGLYYWAESASPITPGTTYSVSLSLAGGSRDSAPVARNRPKPTPGPPPRTCETLTGAVTVSGPGLGEQCNPVNDAAGVGDAAFVAAGFLGAVDVWGYVAPGVTVCFEGSGALGFLDAATAPRTRHALIGSVRDGQICATINRAGTVVLLPAEAAILASLPPLPMSAGSTSRRDLSGCMVTATHVLNLRAGPAGAVIGYVGAGWRLTATGRSPGWYEVDAVGVTGWISADYVAASDNCA